MDPRMIVLPLGKEEVVTLDGRPHLVLSRHGAQCLVQLLERQLLQASSQDREAQRELRSKLSPLPVFRNDRITLDRVWRFIAEHEPISYLQLAHAFDAVHRSNYLNRALRRLEKDGDIFRTDDECYALKPRQAEPVAKLRLIG